MKQLRDAGFVEIRHGNVLLMPCQGDEGKHCCGMLRIPFTPGIDSASGGEPLKNGMLWTRTGGTTLNDLTLSPSIDAAECGHFHIIDGKVVG